MARMKGGDPCSSRVPLRVAIGHGTQMEASEVWGSTDKGTLMVVDDDTNILHSPPSLALANNDGEGGG